MGDLESVRRRDHEQVAATPVSRVERSHPALRLCDDFSFCALSVMALDEAIIKGMKKMWCAQVRSVQPLQRFQLSVSTSR
jgi:hypothetical protein